MNQKMKDALMGYFDRIEKFGKDFLIKKAHKIYRKRVLKLKSLVRSKKKRIRIVFILSVPSMFPSKSLFKYLLNDDTFSPTVLILPDLRFGKERIYTFLEECKTYFAEFKDYTRIVPYDESRCTPQLTFLDKLKSKFSENETVVSFLKSIEWTLEYAELLGLYRRASYPDSLRHIADIVVYPYTYLFSYSEYSIRNCGLSGGLPMIINYGYPLTKYFREVYGSDEYTYAWKVVVEDSYALEEAKCYAQLKGENAIVAGYPKMDDYANYKKCTKRKTVIVAFHHSIEGGYNDLLGLSNFYKYADYFLNLPDRYPQIDFVFRPHLALFVCLENPCFWGKEKTDKYIAEIKSKDNVIYSEGGDYFQYFKNSDGMIQDCGSFLLEYFYTMKPQCYMLKSPQDSDDKFVEMGKQCLAHSYIAYQEDEITQFIEKVILNNEDEMKEERERFAKNTVMYNYPHVSREITTSLKSLFKK